MSIQPGDRVHHKCLDPYCPLFGTVTEVFNYMEEPSAMVKWDPFIGAETSITEATPPLPIRRSALELVLQGPA